MHGHSLYIIFEHNSRRKKHKPTWKSNPRSGVKAFQRRRWI
jgi:hypothetical protein